MVKCEHKPDQISVIRGGGVISKTGDLIYDEKKIYICDCGESWEYDPNRVDEYEPEENLRKELSDELH
jgi:hypothetical protein